jgi:DNA-binding GntR family transcriptional regulator
LEEIEKVIIEIIEKIEEEVFSCHSMREKLENLSELSKEMSDALFSMEKRAMSENNASALAIAVGDLCRLLERTVSLLPEIIRPLVYEPEYP